MLLAIREDFRFAYIDSHSIGLYRSIPSNLPLIRTKKWVPVFSVMHVIHIGFLAASVGLSDLPIVPVKLIGGFLAYVGILCYPFFIGNLRRYSLPSDVLLLRWFRDGHAFYGPHSWRICRRGS